MSFVSTEDLSVSYFSDHKAAVVYDTPKPPTGINSKDENGSDEIAFWGDDNLFPEFVIEQIRKNGTISSGLDFEVRALYSGGVEYGTMEGEKFIPGYIQEIEDFKLNSNLNAYLRNSISDLFHLGNFFPEFYLSNNRQKVTLLYAQPAMDCRWQKRKKGEIAPTKCFLADWKHTPDDKFPVPAINPYYYPLDELRGGDKHRYIYPVSYPDPKNKNYSLAPWHAILNTSWPEVANAIPKFKKALLKNQITIKYLIRVPDMFWKDLYAKWDQYTAQKKEEIKKTYQKKFDEFLSGEDNAGKSIMVTMKSDLAGKMFPGWEIQAVDDKIKDGVYIEDSQEANQHLLFAIGVDPVLIGISPGTKMGGSGGSDKRVAYNNWLALCHMNRDMILEPLQFITKYNNWGDRLVWRFRTSLQTNADISKEPKQSAS